MNSAEHDACLLELGQATCVRDVDLIKSKYLGKKSQLTQQFIELKNLPELERRQQGLQLNLIRDAFSLLFEKAYASVKLLELQSTIESTTVDPTAPCRRERSGSRHPVNLARARLMKILKQLNFQWVDGQEIEDEEHNFTRLNVPEDHPARAEQDTFYLQDFPLLLRTHTSPVQVRELKRRAPPIRIMAPGRVYRSDMDATHTPMFHQLEGLVIEPGLDMGHLKGMIISLLRTFFDKDDLKVRFRPAYFPFTEPSAEVDIWWQGRWLEVLGSGMVHPKVLRGMEINPDECQGYAFGLGIDRLAMLRYGVNDLRLMFENDHRLSQCFQGIDV